MTLSGIVDALSRPEATPPAVVAGALDSRAPFASALERASIDADFSLVEGLDAPLLAALLLSLIHISEPTRR
ncbi:hypothetical protein, partial [uncultured Microbacterium sp.]|uniref:hypothetical protein n=1 Tax=uncultured Microbacterium sp. TaxID=191216 RepID=UPI002618E614